MTETERTYVVPLRAAWMKKVDYKKTRAAVQQVKKFIARHMKIPDHDVDKVRVDIHLNNELWFRGSRNPPARVTVKTHRQGDLVIVKLAEEPKHIGFARALSHKRHKKADSGKTKVVEKEKTQEEKKAEEEKEQSVAIANEKLAEQTAKATKHTTKVKTPKINRMALQK